MFFTHSQQAASEQQQQQQKLVLFPCTLMCVCGSSQHSVQWEACAFELMHATFTVCSRLSTACVSWGRSFLNLPCAKEEAMEARMYMCVCVFVKFHEIAFSCVCVYAHALERERSRNEKTQLTTVDLLARASMKNAASREMWCELQNSANH